ncbi:MAG: hypothetical protein DRI84_02040 [Bacteroidetes bacterium]|nr:MAG: hypothetical protein DRI84_02040 [Bacteroidota bacterium]
MIRQIILIIAFCFITVSTIGQHFVILKSGKKIECVVNALNNDTLEIYVDMMLQKVPLIEVTSIYFAQHVEYDGKLTEKAETISVKSGTYTIQYKIKNRKMTTIPPVSNATEKKGRVVVKVTIDRYGNVMKAEPGYIGSTTTDKYLLTKAMTVAKAARFDIVMTDPLSVEGIIIINY